MHAGRSPLSHKVGIRIKPDQQTWGVCTSSGTVGPSLSLGRADAACVVAPDTALADACATALGNRVPAGRGHQRCLGVSLPASPACTGAVVVVGEHLGAWGDIEVWCPSNIRRILLRSVKSIRRGDEAGQGRKKSGTPPPTPLIRQPNYGSAPVPAWSAGAQSAG